MAVTVDPLDLLAFAMAGRRCVYAVLLGAGVSSAAGIPSGRDITLDLVRKLAAVTEDRDPGDIDPEQWFRERFDALPTYSGVVEALGKTPAERQALLQSYIEPSPDEAEAGRKVPSAAHHALARLVINGYVRVILTTNFDRLVEGALEQAGVDFDLVAAVDDLRGVRPVGQAPCLVVKLHGDYRDARIRNTDQELEAYEAGLDELLDRVLVEYALIVCGWSASWDQALRNAVARSSQSRYTTWWVEPYELSSDADRLARQRKAEVIHLPADEAFERLEAKVQSLQDLNASHPLAPPMAVAELKRYVSDQTKRMRLRDLVIDEARRVRAALTGPAFLVPPAGSTEAWRARANQGMAVSEVLVALFAAGGAWCRDPAPLRDGMELVANLGADRGGDHLSGTLTLVPALACMYAAGIGALSTENWAALHAVTYEAMRRTSGSHEPAAVSLNQYEVFGSPAVWLASEQPTSTPASSWLYQGLRAALCEPMPDAGRYEETFDRFEYLLGSIIEDQRLHGSVHHWRAPVGRFATSHRQFLGPGESERGVDIGEAFDATVQAAGDGWPALQAGLFGGRIDRATAALREYRETIDGTTRGWL